MALDQKDLQMLSVSIPVVDYWEMKEDIDRLEDAVNRLEKVVEALILLHKEERVKSWEMILREMLKKEEQKGNRNVSRFK
jgi:hypothetical protein